MKYELSEILPHKSPMILVDEVVEYDLEKLSLKARIDIGPDSMFYDSVLGGVPSWIGLEYMAQSIGALSGLHGKEHGEGEPIMGFILGTRKYDNAIDFYKNGESYFVEIEELFFNLELGSFRCVIKDSKDEFCAEAELNVFRPQEPLRFIEELGKR